MQKNKINEHTHTKPSPIYKIHNVWHPIKNYQACYEEGKYDL